MSNYKNENDLLNEINNSKTVEGQYSFDSKNDELMDLDINNINFENCTMHNGDFCSSVFYACSFNKVIFRESSLTGTIFKNCDFIKCRFSNIEPDMDFIDCKIGLVSLSKETLEVALRPWE